MNTNNNTTKTPKTKRSPKRKPTTPASGARRKGMNTTLTVSGSIAVQRIRTPHPHDVLSGRGGGINSHIGNKTFREWVRVRKEAYNLAPTKAEKAKVANEVISLVKALDPPGRFLTRDPSSSANTNWWVEVDEARALAKTSQALREGAPQIRAAHKDELQMRLKKTPKRKKPAPVPVAASSVASNAVYTTTPMAYDATTALATTPSYATPTTAHTESISMSTEQIPTTEPPGQVRIQIQPRPGSHIVAPLMSNREFEESYGRSSKRVRVDESRQDEPTFNAMADTPPLTSVPSPRVNMPPLDANSSFNSRLKRTNSLALSDICESGGADEGDFVNPFLDESKFLLGASAMESPVPSTPRSLRNLSSGESGYTANGFRKISSIGSWSTSRSISDFRDLPDLNDQGAEQGIDFGEGMKLVYDAVHPDLTSPDKDDWIPTHLAPWRGGTYISRRSSNGVSPRTLGRQ